MSLINICVPRLLPLFFGKKLGMRKANICSYLQTIPDEVDQIACHVVLGGLLIVKNFKRFLCVV
jgi:hypothetical protein